MPGTIDLQHPLDDPRLRRASQRTDGTLATAPVDSSARYHHPHFVETVPGPWEGQLAWHFRPFSGREAQPLCPADLYMDASLTGDQRRLIEEEYDTAQIMWFHARLRLEATPLLRQAEPLWKAWDAARAELHRAFEAFWTLPAPMWRAQALRLIDAERAAEAAATAWDTAAGRLAGLAADQVAVAGEWHELMLSTIAHEIGLNTNDWEIAPRNAYQVADRFWGSSGCTPLVGSLHEEIREQRGRLRAAADIVAGIPGTSEMA